MAAKQIKLYGGEVLSFDRETKGTLVFSAEVNGRKQSQYAPKIDLNGETPTKVRVILEVVE